MRYLCIDLKFAVYSIAKFFFFLCTVLYISKLIFSAKIKVFCGLNVVQATYCVKAWNFKLKQHPFFIKSTYTYDFLFLFFYFLSLFEADYSYLYLPMQRENWVKIKKVLESGSIPDNIQCYK